MRKQVALLCLAATLLLCLAGCAWPKEKTVNFGGQSIVIDRRVPENTLQAKDFTKQENGRITYSGGDYMTGIDVSAHQGKIDWKKVAKEVDFAMIRVGYRGYTEGKLVEDEQFRRNVKQALKQNMQVGVYFFSQATTVEEAEEEAEYLLSLIKDYPITLNVGYDWEYIDNVEFGTARTDRVEEDTVTQCAQAFCKTIAEAGYRPAIYCNGMLGYFSYDLAQLPNVDVWYADYAGDSPNFAYQMLMWQYTANGTVDGIKGKVDLNLYFCPDEKET